MTSKHDGIQASNNPNAASLRGRTLSGLAWMLLNNTIGKGLSVIAQIFLGLWLSKDDFAVYALALAVSLSITVFLNGGAYPILMQRVLDFDRLAPKVFMFSLVMNVWAALVITILAPYAGEFFESKSLHELLITIGLVAIIGTPILILRAKLAVENRFKELAFSNTISNLVRQSSLMGFAYCGFGPSSFTLPMILEQVAFGGVALWYLGGWPIQRMPLHWGEFRDIFRQCRWIMLGTLVLTLAAQGDYFMVGVFEDKATLGTYFFGFQLVSSVFVLANASLESVLLPMLAPLSGTPDRQARAYIVGLGTLAFFAFPLSALMVMISPFALNLVWDGKWNEAVIVVQGISLCIPAWLATTLSRALLEAKGLWHVRLWFLALNGIGAVTGAAVGAYLGGLAVIVSYVSGFYLLFGFLQLIFLMDRVVSRSRWSLLKPYVFPMLLTLLSAVIGTEAEDQFFPIQPLFFSGFISCTVFVVLYAILSILFLRSSLDVILPSRLKRRVIV